jgi:hypothetical protein
MPDDIEYAQNPQNLWSCPTCINEIFPFSELEDQLEFTAAISLCANPDYSNLDTHLNNLLYNPLDLNEDEGGGSILDDIDPDKKCYNTPQMTIPNTQYLFANSINLKIAANQDENCLSFLHLNVRSIKKKLPKFRLYSPQYHKFTVIAITETWLKPHSIDLYPLQGYAQESTTINWKPGGGITLYINDQLDYKVRQEFNHVTYDLETLWIELDKKKIGTSQNIIIAGIYRAPGSDIASFNEYLNCTLETIKRENKITYYLGDFNIDLLKHSNHLPTSEFIILNFSHSFTPLINKPTRVTPNSATIIDNIFTNDQQYEKNVTCILPSDLSDHFPILHFSYKPKPCFIPTPKMKRDYSQKNIDKFNRLFADIDWDNVYSENDAQNAYTSMHTKIEKIAKESFPVKIVRSVYKNRLPWLTPSMKNSITKKRKLYAHYLRHPTEINNLNYKKYRNSLKTVLRFSERQHYHTILRENQNNMRKTWQTIKDIIHTKKSNNQKSTAFKINGNLTEDANAIASHFNSFFVNIGPILDAKIPKNNINLISYNKKFPSNMFLSLCDPDEIGKVIDRLKNCATGYDLIPSILLKNNKHIFNPSSPISSTSHYHKESSRRN